MARNKEAPGGEPTAPAAARPAHHALVALTDAFCREHLDGEYEALCRKPAGALARKEDEWVVEPEMAVMRGLVDRLPAASEDGLPVSLDDQVCW